MGGVNFTLVNVTKFTDPIRGDEHVPSPTFSDGSNFSSDSTYHDFGFSVIPSNDQLTNGQLLHDRMLEARNKKAEKLGLRGRAYSDYVESDLLPASVSSRDSQLSSLTPPVKDKQFSKTNPVNNGTSIIDVLKRSSNAHGNIMSKSLDAFNHQVTILQNSNEIMKNSNEIALERNRLLEVQNKTNSALNSVLVDALTSISQSLEFIPTLIETISIGSEKIVETNNTRNSHLFQKNVNDAFEYNDKKNSPSPIEASLNDMSSHLDSISHAHSTISKHQEKQAKHAENEIKNFEDENSPENMSFLDSVFDSISNQFDDFDIFTHLINETTMKEKDL